MTPQEQIARMRAQLVARYKLRDVAGRPEELRQPDTDKRVSLAYASQSIRVRLQQGTSWLNRVDFPVREGWESDLFELTDPHFGPAMDGYITPPRQAPVRQSPTIDIAIANRNFPVDLGRPTRDIPPVGL